MKILAIIITLVTIATVAISVNLIETVSADCAVKWTHIEECAPIQSFEITEVVQRYEVIEGYYGGFYCAPVSHYYADWTPITQAIASSIDVFISFDDGYYTYHSGITITDNGITLGSFDPRRSLNINKGRIEKDTLTDTRLSVMELLHDRIGDHEKARYARDVQLFMIDHTYEPSYTRIAIIDEISVPVHVSMRETAIQSAQNECKKQLVERERKWIDDTVHAINVETTTIRTESIRQLIDFWWARHDELAVQKNAVKLVLDELLIELGKAKTAQSAYLAKRQEYADLVADYSTRIGEEYTQMMIAAENAHSAVQLALDQTKANLAIIEANKSRIDEMQAALEQQIAEAESEAKRLTEQSRSTTPTPDN